MRHSCCIQATSSGSYLRKFSETEWQKMFKIIDLLSDFQALLSDFQALFSEFQALFSEFQGFLSEFQTFQEVNFKFY